VLLLPRTHTIDCPRLDCGLEPLQILHFRTTVDSEFAPVTTVGLVEDILDASLAALALRRTLCWRFYCIRYLESKFRDLKDGASTTLKNAVNKR
jgi:hypothetical protein